jgi:hypothetical protein
LKAHGPRLETQSNWPSLAISPLERGLLLLIQGFTWKKELTWKPSKSPGLRNFAVSFVPNKDVPDPIGTKIGTIFSSGYCNCRIIAGGELDD